MERKNTMLLTVIAVATLLVAVVGATFAYFTASGSTATSTVTVTTESNSSASVSSTPATIVLSAAEMDLSKAGTTYTVSGANETTATTGTDQNGTLVIDVSNSSTTSDYVCTYNLTTTATGYTGDAEDIALDITTSYGDLADYSTTFAAISSGTTTLNGSSKITFTVAKAVNTSTPTTATVTYDLALTVKNVSSDQTTDLADKSLTTTIAASDFTCTHTAS